MLTLDNEVYLAFIVSWDPPSILNRHRIGWDLSSHRAQPGWVGGDRDLARCLGHSSNNDDAFVKEVVTEVDVVAV